MKLKRNYYILRCRLHIWWQYTKEKIFKQLAKWGWVVEHKKSYTTTQDQGTPQSAPDIKSERFVFSVSYLIRKIEHSSEYWFESKRGKKLFVVYDDHHLEHRICYRAELKSFFAHFSPKMRQWVHSHSPVVQSFFFNGFDKLDSMADTTPVLLNTYRCDFTKCRYAFEFSVSPDTLKTPAEEVIAESYRVLRNGLNEKVVEINTLLTGAKNDGAMTSKSGMPLSDNLVCKRCGYPVFASPKNKYFFECIHHGEIDYVDCNRVDPKKYEDILANCMSELEYFCECPQD